jgi:hypothetical protein
MTIRRQPELLEAWCGSATLRRDQLAEWIESGELILMEENGIKKLRRRRYAILTA